MESSCYVELLVGNLSYLDHTVSIRLCREYLGVGGHLGPSISQRLGGGGHLEDWGWGPSWSINTNLTFVGGNGHDFYKKESNISPLYYHCIGRYFQYIINIINKSEI